MVRNDRSCYCYTTCLANSIANALTAWALAAEATGPILWITVTDQVEPPAPVNQSIENERGCLTDAGPADDAGIAGAAAVGVELQQEEVVRAGPVAGAQALETLGGIRKPAVLGIIDGHDGEASRN